MSVTLNFHVCHQRITRADSCNLVADSLNYAYAHFGFCSSDWDGLIKTAVFTRGQDTYEQILEDDQCLIPWEVLPEGKGIFTVSVFAGNRITTNTVKVKLDASGWSFALESSQPPTEGVYSQILTRLADVEDTVVESAESAAQSATSAAESAQSAEQSMEAARTAKNAAEEAAGSVTQYSKTSESWAVGGTGTRTGEDTDNSKYYAEKAGAASQTAVSAGNTATGAAQAATQAAGSASQSAQIAAEGAQTVQELYDGAVSDITAAKTAAVGAIQTKGDQVLDSIPEDYSELSGDVTQLKADFLQLDDTTNTNVNSIISGKTRKAETANNVLITGDSPVSVRFDASAPVSVKSRNRFNLTDASFAFNGYTTSNTLTKTATGIKDISAQTSTSSYTYAYTTYTAEHDGLLYFSCRARCDGTTRKSVRDLRVAISVNDVAQELLYGNGLLFERVNVHAGDTVQLRFYVHGGTAQGNTVYYEDIMLAYGDLYEYEPYKEDDSNRRIAYKTKTVNNLDGNSTWTSRAATEGAGRYCTTSNTPLSDMRQLPASNNDVANIVVSGGLEVVSYNATYHGSTGIAVSTTGNLSIYKDGMDKSALVEWLANNPISVTYEINEQETVTVDLNHSFIEGERIVFDTPTAVTYYADSSEKDKICVCFGDSITGMFGNGADYPAMISLTSPVDTINAGFSGSRWTDHNSASYLPFSMNRLADAVTSGDYSLQDASPLVDTESASYAPLYAEHLTNLKAVDWNKVDFVTLFWGTNDYLSSVIIKSADDPATENKQRSNVEDAVRYTITKLLTAYPWLRIIVLTPYWMTNSGIDSNVATDGNGKYLYEFCDAIEKVAKDEFNLPTMNQYHTLGVNMLNKYYFEKDDAHPTERLKWIFANRIINQIKLNT